MNAILTTDFDLQLEIVGHLIAAILGLTTLDGEQRQHLIARNMDASSQVSQLAVNFVT
jgi:hypothetical protein